MKLKLNEMKPLSSYFIDFFREGPS